MVDRHEREGAPVRHAPFRSRAEVHVLKFIKLTAAVVAALLWISHLTRYYVFPRDRLIEVITRCENDSDKLMVADTAKSAEAHHDGVFNPYQRQRDERVETCIKADGWCSMSDENAAKPSHPTPATFAPRDPIARAVYGWRYANKPIEFCRY